MLSLSGDEMSSPRLLLHSNTQAGHSKDTKGLNLLRDIGFPLGGHKRRAQRP